MPVRDPFTCLSEALSDRYRIERRLGQGGMATVYLAEDLKHDRKVAVKVLRPELAAVLGAERFVNGIKTTASLVKRSALGAATPDGLPEPNRLMLLTNFTGELRRRMGEGG